MVWVGFGVDRCDGWCRKTTIGLIASERTQLRPSCFLHRFRIDEMHRTSLGATREVFSLSRYVPDLMFVPSPARFTSASRNTQHLWPQTTFLKSPRRSALIGIPLAPPSALVASGPTMFSSSPTSIFCLVASSPELRSARSLLHPQALNKSFRTSPGATQERCSLSRYVLDFEFVPSSARFTLASHNT